MSEFDGSPPLGPSWEEVRGREAPPAPLPDFSYRQWLVAQLVLRGTNIFLATEAVATTALEHPEWDMDERKTWVEWEKSA